MRRRSRRGCAAGVSTWPIRLPGQSRPRSRTECRSRAPSSRQVQRRVTPTSGARVSSSMRQLRFDCIDTAEGPMPHRCHPLCRLLCRRFRGKQRVAANSGPVGLCRHLWHEVTTKRTQRSVRVDPEVLAAVEDLARQHLVPVGFTDQVGAGKTGPREDARTGILRMLPTRHR